MQTRVFNKFREVIFRESGISLNNDKIQLLANRIQKRLRALGIEDEEKYLEIIETDSTREELVELIDAVSTNVTYFYREPAHFEFLAKIFDQYRLQKKDKIRIWCAAASSGEEPYTTAITAAEHLNLNSIDFKFLATDICTRVLRIAAQGCYLDQHLEKVPAAIRAKYFSQKELDGETVWQISEDVSRFLSFKILNLSRFPIPLKGPIDLIFCRNVMIYFDRPLRAKLVAEFERLLAPGGYLFVSHTENLLGISHSLKTRAVGVYQKEL